MESPAKELQRAMVTSPGFSRVGTGSAHVNTTSSAQVKPKLKFAIVDGEETAISVIGIARNAGDNAIREGMDVIVAASDPTNH